MGDPSPIEDRPRGNSLLPIAQNLFLMLATITIIWSAAWWVIEKDDLNQVFVNFLRRFMALGFFWAVLLFADRWIPAVIDGFAMAGQQAAGAASGGTPRLNPSAVLDQGITIANSILEDLSLGGIFSNPATSLVSAIALLLTLLAFVIIAAQLVITLVEMYIVIGAGVLMLGFAGSPWTLSFAERYLSYAVSVGVELFVLYLIIGLGSQVVGGWQATIDQTAGTPDALFAVVGASLVYMFVAWQVPSMASSLIGGGVNLNLGSAVHTTATPAGVAAGGPALGMRMTGGAIAGGRAIAEAGRYAAAHRAAGGGMAGSAVQAGGALAASATTAVANRWSQRSRETTADVLRERRLTRAGAKAASSAAASGAPTSSNSAVAGAGRLRTEPSGRPRPAPSKPVSLWAGKDWRRMLNRP
jgi:type IV secretion system protein TrbL